MNDKVTGSPGSLDAPWGMYKYGHALSHSEKAMSPQICVATFFTEFRVDANYDITT